MNSSCEAVRASVVRKLSWMSNRTRSTRTRGFRPLAEPMEARVVPSHVSVTAALVAPAAIGTVRPPGAAGVAAMDTVVVNGQVEVQPGD